MSKSDHFMFRTILKFVKKMITIYKFQDIFFLIIIGSMFRIKNIRNSTVAKQTNININQSLNKPSPLLLKAEIKQKKEIVVVKKNANLPINIRKPIANIKIATPKPKLPEQKRVILDAKNNKVVAQKLNSHLPTKIIQKTSISIANKKQNIDQKKQKQLGQKNSTPSSKIHDIQQEKIEEKSKNNSKMLIQNLQKIVQEQQIQKQQKEAVNFILKKQQEHKQKQLDQKSKLLQEEKKKKKQAEFERTKLLKQIDDQQHLKRQLQLKQMTEKINARRKAREQQRQKKANLERQMQNQIGGIGGIVALSDPLAHIQMSEAIMDKQVQLLINMKFAGYPNKQAIQTQVEELERINRSYLLVRTDPSNPLNRGLSNFRIQLFNRVGELVMQSQAAQGGSPSGLRVFDSDTRNHPQIEGMKITRGLQGHISSVLKRVKLEQAEQCAVCLNQIQRGQLIYKVPCEHIFHEKCLEDWLNTNANCPSCRFNIKYNHY